MYIYTTPVKDARQMIFVATIMSDGDRYWISINLNKQREKEKTKFYFLELCALLEKYWGAVVEG